MCQSIRAPSGNNQSPHSLKVPASSGHLGLLLRELQLQHKEKPVFLQFRLCIGLDPQIICMRLWERPTGSGYHWLPQGSALSKEIFSDFGEFPRFVLKAGCMHADLEGNRPAYLTIIHTVDAFSLPASPRSYPTNFMLIHSLLKTTQSPPKQEIKPNKRSLSLLTKQQQQNKTI